MGAVLRMLGLAVAFFIAIGIALVALEANEDSGLVEAWLDGCRWLVAPFDDIFDLRRGREKLQIAINWGIAALVYLAIAMILARLVARVRRPRWRFRRRAA
jgi:drug/metabolite transporter (DMT)-like permease